MFNIIQTKPTPSLARKLIKFSDVRHIDLSPEIIDLAMDDLLTLADFKGFNLHLTPSAIAAIQHHRDWGRSVILTTDYQMAMNATMANIWSKPGKTVVISDIENAQEWVKNIRHVWPNSTISIAGNKRYQDVFSKALEKYDIQITKDPDLTCDFIIMTGQSLLWHDLASNLTWDHTIVDRLPNSMRRNELMNLFKELPNPVIIQNLLSMPTTAGITANDGIESHSNNTFNYAEKMLDSLWCGQLPIRIKLEDPVLDGYAADRKYNLTPRRYLELQGVSFDLVKTNEKRQSYVIFGDTQASSREQSRGAIERISGKAMTQAISDALVGDRSSLDFLEQYRTHPWSMGKAHHTIQCFQKISSASTRHIIICENDYLNRAMRLNLPGHLMGDFKSASLEDRQKFIDRFTKDPLFVKRTAVPLKHLMMTMDEFLELSDILLDHRTFLVIPDISSVDPRILDDVMELCRAHATKMILPLNINTFEDFFFKEALKNISLSAK